MNNKPLFLTVIPLLAILLLICGCSNGTNTAGTLDLSIEMVTVPDVAGLTFEQAQAELQEVGLEIQKQDQDSDLPSGSIISTTPAAGEELAKGEAVVTITSRGPQAVPLPSLVGKSEADACSALGSLGLQPNVRRNYSEQVKAGLVYAMEPAPNSSVAPGSGVNLSVSLGSGYTTCGTCGGSGTITSTRTCPVCNGTGTCYT